MIPQGHPLYSLIGTQYQHVLEEYLGTTASYSNQVCTLHGSGYTGGSGNGGSSALPGRITEDARQLIASAESRLAALDPSGEQYRAIVSAATYLRSLLDSGTATEADIMAAMTELTRTLIN